MKITLLGTGDAIGTPKVGCDCPQCTRAKATGTTRLRTSLLIENKGRHLLIDSSPDLRAPAPQAGSPHIDAVIWTHGHYDHFIGFGEFYRIQPIPPVFAAPQVLNYCSETFRFLSFEKVRSSRTNPLISSASRSRRSWSSTRPHSPAACSSRPGNHGSLIRQIPT